MPQTNWNNKKANFMGDSLTAGSNTWPDKLGQLLGLSEVRNYAISGTLLSGADTDTTAMVNRIDEMDEDADFIFLFGGGNDWVEGVEIGAKYVVDGINYLPNLDQETFYGALHLACQRLINRYPTKRIVLVTMIHSGGDISTNSAGYCMLDYVNAVRGVGEWYGIPVLDFWKNIGINPALVSQQIYMADVLYHLNGAGHDRAARVAASFMESTFSGEMLPELVPYDQLFFDNFDRADSTTTLGSQWDAVAGTWGIDTNTAYCVSDGAGEIAVLANPLGTDDYSVSVLATGDTTNYDDNNLRIPRLIARYIDVNNYLHIDIIEDTMYFAKMDGGVDTILLHAPTPVPTTGGVTFHLRLTVNGDSITGNLNDEVVISYTLDPSDSKFLSGTAGMAMDVLGTPDFDLRFDNFRVESLD